MTLYGHNLARLTKVYPCKAWVQNGGKTLKVRGFVGISLLGMNTYWSRVS